MALNVGDAAPDFTLLDQSGTPLALKDQRGKKVLVYFYPKADTPGCTTQSCGLRDIKQDVGDTVIIGITPTPRLSSRSSTTSTALDFRC